MPPQAFTQALTLNDYSTNVLKRELVGFDLLGVPLHLAQVEAVKTTYRETGISFENALRLAPAQQNLLPEQVHLEPTELAQALSYQSAIKMNQALAAAGLQVKAPEGWRPTEAGKQFANLHQWGVGNKSGVNLKWNLEGIREAMGISA